MINSTIPSILLEIKDGNNLGEPITLLGATKTVPVDVINQAVSLGLKVVAENKVQEFLDKKDSISADASQHFIGHLQTNKVKFLVGQVDLIHSVDSLHLAREISKHAVKNNIKQKVLVEINIASEPTKSGFSPSDAIDSVIEISKLEGVIPIGLMAMLPKTDDQVLLSDLCEKMRSIYDYLKNSGLPFRYLSLGMSEDYKIAINHGSNLIRLGSALFGKRNYGDKI